jgi:hypothetical protein
MLPIISILGVLIQALITHSPSIATYMYILEIPFNCHILERLPLIFMIILKVERHATPGLDI